MKSFKYDMKKHSYDPETKTIRAKETDIPGFDMAYEVESAQGGKKVFNLKESTGSEWDPNTKWIYKSDDDMTLEVSQDAALTKRRADAYLHHKLNRD